MMTKCVSRILISITTKGLTKQVAQQNIKVIIIDDKSPHLKTVIALGDANKGTLGFFPEGAFRSSAAKQEIIVAIDTHARCIGYLLYSASTRYKRLKIIHLCVDPSYRGQGIAQKLVNYLVESTQKEDCFDGIGLTCRQDYNLHDMWARFGFVPKHDKEAKTPGKINTYWWRDYGKPNLLSELANSHRDSKLSVAIDYHLMMDIYEGITDAQVVLADWLHQEIELCVPDEILNLIHRDSQSDADKDKQKKIGFAKKFTHLTSNYQKSEVIKQDITAICRAKNIHIDEYQIRYISKIIQSYICVMITNEIGLLDIADILYDKFKLSILSHTDLVNQHNEIPNYQPVRLAGTRLEKYKLKKGEENLDYFIMPEESKVNFRQSLLRFLTHPDKFECSVVKDADRLLALVVYDRHKQHELEVPMIRVADTPLAETLARHIIFQSIVRSTMEQRQFTRINDPYLSDPVITAIEEDSFVMVNDGRLRANVAVAQPASQLSRLIIKLADDWGDEYKFCRELAGHLGVENSTQDGKLMLEIEKHLWPAKIIDANIPTFIIPIEPRWAKELFDYKLAQQCLFDNQTELALNREAVYYKSKKSPKTLKPGIVGRILWYVSSSPDKDGGYSGIGAIRACSRLDEVVIGKSKALFERFRNLGVYKVEDILKIANNDETQDIMALKFSYTEIFNTPVDLAYLRKMEISTIRTSIYIDSKKFESIYKAGQL